MNPVYILVSTLVGGLIGWGTNMLAVKLIFRPYEPFNFLGLTIQGLLPKRRKDIAEAIGQTVENDLLSSEEILHHLNNPELQEKIKSEIVTSLKLKVQTLLPSFIPSALKEHFYALIEGAIEEEVAKFFTKTIPKLGEEMKESLPIAAMVETKINELDIENLEKIILKIAHKELKHIEYLGGLLGLIIGLTQGLFFMLLT